jgi:hypothetical protein
MKENMRQNGKRKILYINRGKEDVENKTENLYNDTVKKKGM